MIGIIGSKDNSEIKLIKKNLEGRGIEVVILDLTNFPEDFKVDIENKNFSINSIDLNKLDGLYINSLLIKGFPFKDNISAQDWIEKYNKFREYQVIEREKTAFKYAVISYLISLGKVVVNHPLTYEYHSMKIFEYYLLSGMNLKFPETITSNDPETLKQFIRKHNGSALYKANVGGYLHTTLLDENVIDEIAESLTVRPILLQQYIKGYNIRCYVIDDYFICAGRIYQDETYVDSRMGFKGVELIELPGEVIEKVLAISKKQNLIFSGIDLMYSETEKEYYLLECNSSPMFNNFEKYSGAPIAEKLTDYFIRKIG